MSAYFRRVRGFPRDIKLFLAYSLLANVGFGVSQLIFNLYLTELGYREDFIGAFNGALTLSMAAAAVSMGVLLNRFGPWRCIVGGVGIFFLASFGLALAEAPWLLLALAGLNGVGLAFLFTATMPFVIEWTRRDQRPEVAALSFSLISLATMLGSLAGGVVPSLVPGVADVSVAAYRWTLIGGTAVACLGYLPLFLMGPARRGRGPTETATRLVEDDAERRQVRRDMTVFVAIGGLMALGAGMVMPFYNVYLRSLGGSAREIGYIYAAGGLVSAVLGLGAPAVARRLGSIRAVVLVRWSVVPFYALLILSPGYGLAIVAHLVRQTSISMAWPIDSTFIAEVLPARARGSVFGWRSGAWNVGFSAASLVGGALIVRFGYDGPFFGLILFSILAGTLFAVYFGRHPLIRAGHLPLALPPHKRQPVKALVYGPVPVVAGRSPDAPQVAKPGVADSPVGG
ncbi:MAG: hypothetical protein AVDCRST_MAG73-2666 [uncultured Thermomicrobiales bacterium]|uniref:Major facilitator superfamily (MFS) profile domain-containing protein n=1 Tax=uncultured Thermomicrobiales bacterium TaxID=1645740 RepID=A0A6J4UF74_9BACT|nr:MAG: hypothetical protein AVDCRST_MAG73-2666 [uncultured Thermomicrobiales bacterium]